MHPRVRHKHVDYRTGEVSLTTSKRGARELVYFTRGRDGPLFISDRLCACDVSLLRASARVCDGARFACYVPASIRLPESLRHETRLVRIRIGHFSKKGFPEQSRGPRSPHGPFEAPRQQVWVVEPVSHFAYRWSTHLVLHPRLRSNFIAPQTLAVSRSWLLGEGHFERRSWYDVMRLYIRYGAIRVWLTPPSGFRKSPGRTFEYLLFYAVFYVGSPVAVLYA